MSQKLKHATGLSFLERRLEEYLDEALGYVAPRYPAGCVKWVADNKPGLLKRLVVASDRVNEEHKKSIAAYFYRGQYDVAVNNYVRIIAECVREYNKHGRVYE